MEFPKTRAQTRYERIISNMIQITSELTESQLIELYEIALQMFAGRSRAEDKLYEESKARANRE